MTDFILPDIGEGIVECELLKWLVSEGDIIQEDQAVAEVMTDKATVEIPAMYSGIVTQLYYQEGDIAKVHQPLFAMSKADENQSKNTDLPQVDTPNKQQANNQPLNNQQIEPFILPDIGEGIVECEIMQWHIKEGDIVKEDEVVVEVMTDKAVVEIPAKYDGRIVKLHYAKGDIAAVHSVLFDQRIALSNNSESQIKTQTDLQVLDKKSEPDIQSINNKANKLKHQNSLSTSKQGENFNPPVTTHKCIASPAVRRLARENAVALDAVNGSGHKGRVLKQDILSFIQSSSSVNTSAIHQQANILTSQEMEQKHRLQQQDKVVPVKGIQAAMAKQMMASVSTIPHFTVGDELCMDALIKVRASLKSEFEAQAVKLSFMPFFIKAMSLALLQFPVINSRLNSDATELTYLSSHNIGIAVDSKLGLLVPNIKNVQNLSLFEIALAFNQLIDKARAGKLTNDDLSGGSISISNIGALGGINATPVINKPDVAIVALGKMQKLPRFNEAGNVYASNIMMLNWSGDHRVIDGATMVRFNNLWMDYLEHPEKMLAYLR